MFQIQNEIKLNYLNSKKTKTAQSDSHVLKEIDKYELSVNKYIYDISISEAIEMLTRFPNSSLNAISKNKSIIKKYIDYCMRLNLVEHGENRFELITRDMIKNYVSKNALDYKYITPSEKLKYIKLLENEQDKAFIEALYIGIRGKTTEEIINLQIDEKSDIFKENKIVLNRNDGTQRIIEISDFTKKILLDAKHQEEYVSNNGVESLTQKGGMRITKIKKIGNYVFRIPSRSKLFNPILLNSRIQRFQQWIGNEYLTMHSLYMSGMITEALKIFIEKNEITMKEYDDICQLYGYRIGEIARAQTLKDIVANYINNKEVLEDVAKGNVF